MLDILAIGVHPDDIEVGCGGFLIKAKKQGCKIGMLILTKGGASPDGSEEIREAEAKKAAEFLKADYFEMLDFKDGKVEYSTQEASSAVADKLMELKPKLVLSIWNEDHHPDHRATTAIVKKAAYLCDTAEYKKIDYCGPEQILYYILGFKKMVSPDFLIDITEEFEMKKEAFAIHASQQKFLPLIEMYSQTTGILNGTKYAEGFKTELPLKLSNIKGLL
jgi:N-acetylglucosamine malate deacetylase 1